MARPTAKRGERTEANPTGEIREERTEANSTGKTDEESDDNKSILRTEDEDSEEEERVPVHSCRERRDSEVTPAQRELEAMQKLFIEGLGFNYRTGAGGQGFRFGHPRLRPVRADR